MKRWLAAPLRLALGLPAFYGITVGNRALQILRAAGLYRGPIHFVVRPKTMHIRSVIQKG